MDNELIKQLIEDTSIDDIAEGYQPIVDIIGLDNFIALSDYAKGDKLYFPKKESIIAQARNRMIKKMFDGYNAKQLAEKFNLTVQQIQNILKDEQIPGQMELKDYFST